MTDCRVGCPEKDFSLEIKNKEGWATTGSIFDPKKRVSLGGYYIRLNAGRFKIETTSQIDKLLIDQEINYLYIQRILVNVPAAYELIIKCFNSKIEKSLGFDSNYVFLIMPTEEQTIYIYEWML